MNLKEKRKKIEEMILTTMNKMDKTCTNGNKYKAFFKSMSDDQFSKWAKSFLNDPEENFYMEILPYKNEPKLKDLIEAGKYLNVPLDEYIYYRDNGNKDNPLRSKYKVPVG